MRLLCQVAVLQTCKNDAVVTVLSCKPNQKADKGSANNRSSCSLVSASARHGKRVHSMLLCHCCDDHTANWPLASLGDCQQWPGEPMTAEKGALQQHVTSIPVCTAPNLSFERAGHL